MRDAGAPDEHCHPHVLRHTFATLHLRRRAHDSGALTKLQDLLGHASPEPTRGYLHHTRDELERTHARPRTQRPRCSRRRAHAPQRSPRYVALAGVPPDAKPAGAAATGPRIHCQTTCARHLETGPAERGHSTGVTRPGSTDGHAAIKNHRQILLKITAGPVQYYAV